MAETRWLPLESNPDVMNKYMQRLGLPEDEAFTDVFDLSEEGLKTIPRPVRAVLLLFPDKYMSNLGLPSSWAFSDVYGLDADLLAIVPHPIVAVGLLYPLTDKSEEQEIGTVEENSDLYFIKQTIGNACGTICLIHSVLNNTDSIQIDSGKHLLEFYEATQGMNPTERAAHLENDTAFGEAHEESAQEGQTQAPDRNEKTNLHFVAFVHHNGGLYELDGRKDAPVRHGDTTPDTLLEDTAAVVKKFMERDPEELNFTVVALTKAAA